MNISSPRSPGTPDTVPSETRSGYRALLTAFVVLAVAFSFGLYSLPVFYPVLLARDGWTRAEAAAGGSIVLLLIGVLGPLMGRLGDAWSPKRVLLAGMAVSVGALTLLSTANGLPEFYAFCAILGVGIAASSLVPASMLVAPWFQGRRGLAVGIINAGVGVGGFLAPNLTDSLIESQGIGGAFRGLALCLSIPLLVVLLLAPGKGAYRRDSRQGDSSIPVRDVLRMSLFWGFGSAMFFLAHTLTGVQQHLALYLTGQGISASQAAFALSVLLGSSAFGKVMGGWLADRASARVSLGVAGLCLMVALGGLLVIDPGSPLLLGSVMIFGLGFGGVFNAPPLIAFECFGTRGVGTILGMFMTFFGLGTSSGGLVAGYLADSFGGYQAPFLWDLTSCGIALALLGSVAARAEIGLGGRGQGKATSVSPAA